MQAFMSEKYLVAIGSSCIDEYYELDLIPRMGDKVLCRYLESKVGGMIGNAVSVYASYGLPAYMIDFVKTGDQTQMLMDDLKRYGVNTDFISFDEKRSDNKCFIMLKDGERLIFVGDNKKEDLLLDEKQLALLNGAEFVYTTIPELLFLRKTRTVIEGFRHAGAKLVLDMEGSTIPDKNETLNIIMQGDIFFVNDSGAERLRDLYGSSIIENMVAKGALVVFTLGAEGCEILHKDRVYPAFPALNSKVIDTTGAGDTFNASFLYGFSRGWSIPDIAFFANAAAARSIGILGPRSGAAGEAAVKCFIKEHIKNASLTLKKHGRCMSNGHVVPGFR
jgi:ribokinase